MDDGFAKTGMFMDEGPAPASGNNPGLPAAERHGSLVRKETETVQTPEKEAVQPRWAYWYGPHGTQAWRPGMWPLLALHRLCTGFAGSPVGAGVDDANQNRPRTLRHFFLPVPGLTGGRVLWLAAKMGRAKRKGWSVCTRRLPCSMVFTQPECWLSTACGKRRVCSSMPLSEKRFSRRVLPWAACANSAFSCALLFL